MDLVVERLRRVTVLRPNPTERLLVAVVSRMPATVDTPIKILHSQYLICNFIDFAHCVYM